MKSPPVSRPQNNGTSQYWTMAFLSTTGGFSVSSKSVKAICHCPLFSQACKAAPGCPHQLAKAVWMFGENLLTNCFLPQYSQRGGVPCIPFFFSLKPPEEIFQQLCHWLFNCPCHKMVRSIVFHVKNLTTSRLCHRGLDPNRASPAPLLLWTAESRAWTPQGSPWWPNSTSDHWGNVLFLHSGDLK